MQRITNAVYDYQQFIDRTGRGLFYASDLCQLRDMSLKDGRVNIYDLMSNALSAGFMIGYRCAKREARKRNKAAEQ